MMNPRNWLNKAAEELAEMSIDEIDRPADAWRAATLISRLLASPHGPTAAPEYVRHLPDLVDASGLADPEQILDSIADELESEEDAWGPLMDGLLDADDVAGVLAILGGRDDESEEFARRVAAMVSLYPQRVLPLSEFAEMRIATVREGHPVAAIWHAVERAPAQLLADSLPAASTPGTRSESGRIVSFVLPSELQHAAADSVTTDTSEIEISESRLKAWVYEEEGDMLLEVVGLVNVASTATLTAVRVDDQQEVGRIDVDLEFSGKTGYANLGPWTGSENLLQKLAEQGGGAEIRVHFSVNDG